MQAKNLFFFQAEDGIRDKLVTGIQTCALPIFMFPKQKQNTVFPLNIPTCCNNLSLTKFHRRNMMTLVSLTVASWLRSEERRVGKECRSWWSSHEYNNKQMTAILVEGVHEIRAE